MPFALIIAGIILTVAGVRSTENALFALLKGDLTGTNSFIWWVISILAIGSVGYLPGMRQLANAFLALIMIVLVLSVNKNGNVFASFTNAFKNPIPPAPVSSNGLATATGNLVKSFIPSQSTLNALSFGSGDTTSQLPSLGFGL